MHGGRVKASTLALGANGLATLPLVRPRNPRQTPPHLLLRLLRRISGASAPIPATSATASSPATRRLRRLRCGYRRIFAALKRARGSRARGRPRFYGMKTHHQPPLPLGRRPHPPCGRRRRPMRPRQPAHPVRCLPPRSHPTAPGTPRRPPLACRHASLKLVSSWGDE